MIARLFVGAVLALPLVAAAASDPAKLRLQLHEAIASGATVKVMHRDIGTAFGLRFLAAHYHHHFGEPALPSSL